MRLQSLVSVLLLFVHTVWAIPPPDKRRVLVVLDDTNENVSLDSIVDPLVGRGFDVSTAGVKDHPKLSEFGDRIYDGVIIIPGRVKALGSTLRQSDLFDFLKTGGSILALTTPKYSPLALRELSKNLGIEVSGRGVEFVDAFDSDLSFPHPNVVVADNSLKGDNVFQGSSVAKLGSNDYLLGLVQCPYTSYSWNAAKVNEDDAKQVATDLFTTGSEGFLAAGVQSLSGSRYVWVGSSHLLTDPALAEQITGWALGEKNELRLNGVIHQSVLQGDGVSHQHYMVEEPLAYCARIEQWNPTSGEWEPYTRIEDVQVEFKMLDPYYRLNLDGDGCVTFVTPQQYGMFTFNLDYKIPGFTFIEDKEVVTIRHRANDEWDRSWLITNSWVYLSGVSTTVFAFLIFCVIYLTLPSTFGSSKKHSTHGSTSAESSSAEKQVADEHTEKGKNKHQSNEKNSRKTTSKNSE